MKDNCSTIFFFAPSLSDVQIKVIWPHKQVGASFPNFYFLKMFVWVLYYFFLLMCDRIHLLQIIPWSYEKTIYIYLGKLSF